VLASINDVAEYLTVDQHSCQPCTKQRGSPRLFVTWNCAHLLEQLHLYQWQGLNNRAPDKNRSKPPRKYNDHAVDALRYGLTSRPGTPERHKHVLPGMMGALKQEYVNFIRAQQEDLDEDEFD